MKCYYCDDNLSKERVYSNKGMSMKCCSILCLARSVLDIREATLKETRRMMGETQ